MTKDNTQDKVQLDENLKCDKKGCGMRKDKNDKYCRTHQEIKAEAQSTRRDSTPAHPTGGMY